MKKDKVIIKNETGLHARPASQFVKKAGEFKSKITLQKDDETASAKSIMAVMGLGAEQGTEIGIKIEGEDEDEAMKELLKLINEKLPEEE